MGIGSLQLTTHNSQLATGILTEADRALLLAMRAWPDPCVPPAADGRETATADDFITRLWNRLDPSWVRRLRETWDRESRAADASEPARALDRLRTMHETSARVALGRVHPSWWVRALLEESPAVQRVVTASLPESLRHIVQAGLLLDSQDLKSDRAVAPEVLGWVLGLWTERLVGGEPERPDDPPAIIALSRLSPRAGYGLCRLVGFCKMLLAGQKPGGERARPSECARWEWLRGRLAAAGPEFQAAVSRDLQAVVFPKLARRHHPARIGLVTFGRLLAECEPVRVRWALQHWPYPISKLTRSLMPPDTQRSPLLVEGESLVLKTAWDRLTLEGRLSMSWPDPGGERTGAN
ncbi:MAG: hypothetical protein ACHRXM_19860 [Isosphaerales bacterium]